MKKIIVVLLSAVFMVNLCFCVSASNGETVADESLDIVSYNYITKIEDVTTVKTTDSLSGTTLAEVNQDSVVAPAYIPDSLTIADESISTCSIIGSDNRLNVNPNTFPYSAVTYLYLGQDTTGNGVANSWGGGTGFMVGNKAMVTAAHCFWNKTYGWVEECRTYIKQNGSTLGSTYYYPASWSVPANYINSLDYQYDWCVIKMQNNLGQYTGYFGFGYDGTLTGNTYTLSGYPGDHKYYQYKSTGTVTSETAYACYYNNDMYAGQSGSPIYDSNYTVWAINTYEGGSFNQGNKITQICADLMNEARALS